MLTRRFTSFNPFLQLRTEMDRLFDAFTGRGNGWSPTAVFPALNVWEDDRNFFVEAELPGVDLKDIELNVTGSELTIQGNRPDPEQKDCTYHRRERGVGRFARMLTLPAEVETDKVEAVMKHGVLTIRLPKSQQAIARKIAIKSN